MSCHHTEERSFKSSEFLPLGSTRPARYRSTHHLVKVRGSGVIPGEDIAVALSISNTEGSADESARAVVELSGLVDQWSAILLIGRMSDAIVSKRLPS